MINDRQQPSPECQSVVPSRKPSHTLISHHPKLSGLRFPILPFPSPRKMLRSLPSHFPSSCFNLPLASLPHIHHRRCRKPSPLSNPKPNPNRLAVFSHLDHFSVDSLTHLLPPLTALGLASSLALSLPKLFFHSKPDPDPNSWILFSSPTPFNRFVITRCPSIHIIDNTATSSIVLEEERHHVRMEARERQEGKRRGFEYRRVCVGCDDGGVVSLDWPAELELSEEENGMDTVVLIVPGTAEGSMDEDVRGLVEECVRSGLFPVVMNPRGCAGSPLTTPRLFSAADSDDVATSIRFISRARPCSTLMAVGYGFGANMLTKYLAEAGERTPLTAATCIDNPFDLEVSTRIAPYNDTINRKLTRGMIDILRSNKELFHGRKMGFDVDKAISAKSLCDFDKSISMISYGFDTLEDFYSNASTSTVIRELKIPVLFILSGDGTVPLFSVPRGSIAANPFASLLMCSMPPHTSASSQSVIRQCQLLTVEWLTAVELALLKGRHPLVEDLEVTVKPSKDLAISRGRGSAVNGNFKRISNFTEFDTSSSYIISPNDILDKRDDAGSNLGHVYDLNSSRELNGKDLADVAPSMEEADPVLQTAEVVMNMLDVTMPGALEEEKRKKVRAAVCQGETLLKALEDAVPEDVRGKLTNSVSEILRAQGKNVNLAPLDAGEFPNLSSGLKLNIGEKMGKKMETEGVSDTNHPPDHTSFNSNGDSDRYDAPGVNESDRNSDSIVRSLEIPLQSVGSGDSQLAGTDDVSKNFLYESGDHSTFDSATEKVPQLSGTVESDLETNSGTSSTSHAKPDNTVAKNGNNNVVNEGPSITNMRDDGVDGTHQRKSYVDAQLVGKEFENQENDEQSASPVLNQIEPAPASNNPSFSVTQALDALTGLDDSTQLAVNSVFGVIENLITQLEEGKGNTFDRGNELESDTISAAEEQPSAEFPLEKSLTGNVSVDARPRLKSASDSGSCYLGALDNQIIDGSGSHGLMSESAESHRNPAAFPSRIRTNPYGDAFYREFLRKYVLSKMQEAKSFDLSATAALSLDYVPELGHWKVQEQQENYNATTDGTATPEPRYTKETESSYAVLNSERPQGAVGGLDSKEKVNGETGNTLDGLTKLINSSIIDSLLVEVSRRLSSEDMKTTDPLLMKDMEEVANAACLVVISDDYITRKLIGSDEDHGLLWSGRDFREQLTEAVYLAVTRTSYLRRVLPVGVILGSCLASLRKLFCDAVFWKSGLAKALDVDETYVSWMKPKNQVVVRQAADVSSEKGDQGSLSDESLSTCSRSNESSTLNWHDEETGSSILSGKTAILGAVTAAVGASAFLKQQQDGDTGDIAHETSSLSLNSKDYLKEDTDKHQNMVTSLAEKAMQVASPVVPTKGDGEVDQDRLVALLARLGQRGGILKLVGKVALLWGGIRGAMSLTDRLILFLRIAERPLHQRLLGFLCMVLVLWSPIVLPLLPTIVHNWATKNPYKVTEIACVAGLYTAVTMLIIIWGKRIRGYEDSLPQYGLDIASSVKIQEFLTGLIGGFVLVLSIHFAYVFLGYARFSWPANLGSVHAMTKLKAYGRLFILMVQGTVTATLVACVEELFFRSWLFEEIATDLGFHPGIVLSGLAFSLSQRSLQAIPGLWLLSLSLSGLRYRMEGRLYIPIGLRTGIIASSFILQMGGFLIYRSKVAGIYPFQPFSGIVGLLVCLVSAITLYPRKIQPHGENSSKLPE
ncbi:Embryogenesis-associated protein EMB8-like protein [Drosera capensis]